MNFSSKYILADDGLWGTFEYDPETGTSKWNGMVRMLMAKKVDIVAAFFYITNDRAKVHFKGTEKG